MLDTTKRQGSRHGEPSLLVICNPSALSQLWESLAGSLWAKNGVAFRLPKLPLSLFEMPAQEDKNGFEHID